MFKPGIYYVGEIAHVLQADDLRTILYEVLQPAGLQAGVKDLIASAKHFTIETEPVFDLYFVAKMPQASGTLYDTNNNPYGFDFGMFGCVPWEWVKTQGVDENKFEFDEPFECAFTNDSVTIGHLHFTLNPQ